MDSQEMYVAAWKQTSDAIVELVADLTEEELTLPTDLPGWTVHDIVAHLAHLEQVANGEPEEPAGVAVVPDDYTNSGVDERRDVPTRELLEGFERDVASRHEKLSSTRVDLGAQAPVTPAGAPWTWETLLRNRAVDVWVHEQDIRRAVGRPGGLGSLGAQVTTHTFAAGMGFVLGKKVQAEPGSVVRWLVEGEVPLTIALAVGDDGRARKAEPTATADATLDMTSETFTILAAGRRSPDEVEVRYAGDGDLAARVLANMTLTF